MFLKHKNKTKGLTMSLLNSIISTILDNDTPKTEDEAFAFDEETIDIGCIRMNDEMKECKTCEAFLKHDEYDGADNIPCYMNDVDACPEKTLEESEGYNEDDEVSIDKETYETCEEESTSTGFWGGWFR